MTEEKTGINIFKNAAASLVIKPLAGHLRLSQTLDCYLRERDFPEATQRCCPLFASLCRHASIPTLISAVPAEERNYVHTCPDWGWNKKLCSTCLMRTEELYMLSSWWVCLLGAYCWKCKQRVIFQCKICPRRQKSLKRYGDDPYRNVWM